MAHVKGSGSVAQHAQGKRHGKSLGIKLYAGQVAKIGMIILRQRGAKYKLGKGTGMGKDHTIFSMINGVVSFGKRRGKTTVSVS